MFTTNRTFRLWHSLGIPIACTPLHSFLFLVLTALAALIPAVQALAIENFVDSIKLTVDGGTGGALVTAAVLLVLITATSMLLPPLTALVDTRLQMRLRKSTRMSYAEKMSRLEYHHIESTKFWELINRLTVAINGQTVYLEEYFYQAFMGMVSFLKLLVTLLSVVWVVMTHIWWVGLLLLALSGPMMLVSNKLGKKSYEKGSVYAEYQRSTSRLGEILLFRPFIFERYLFGYGDVINKKWTQNYKILAKGWIRMGTLETLTFRAGGLFITVITILLILLIAWQTVGGAITIGAFLSLVSVLFSLSGILSWDLSNFIFTLARNNEYFRDLTKFSQLSEIDSETQAVPASSFRMLEFRDVRFKYPETETYVLDGVSFCMEEGKHYSFVGVNGAGKTTITKLLTGLYDQYEGAIYIDDVELRDIPRETLHRYFAVVFQDFARFALTLRENIAMGRAEISEEAIERAAKLSGLEDAGFPNGLNTRLGKIYEDGLELSGGQWQRLAMARCLALDAPVKILDEPTAALDPVSESQVYEQFDQISHGATTIFISHRLGSTKLSDVIFVLEQGRIVQEGSHADLMAQQGVYRQMFDSQRSWYVM